MVLGCRRTSRQIDSYRIEMVERNPETFLVECFRFRLDKLPENARIRLHGHGLVAFLNHEMDQQWYDRQQIFAHLRKDFGRKKVIDAEVVSVKGA